MGLVLLQTEWLDYINVHPFSFVSMVMTAGVLVYVTYLTTSAYAKFRLEHFSIMKVCGLVPESNLTDAERALLLVNHLTLRQEFDELRVEFRSFRDKIEKDFVTVGECRDLHANTNALLEEIRDRGRQRRKEDEEGK